MKKIILILLTVSLFTQSQSQAATASQKILDEAKNKIKHTPELKESQKDILHVISVLKKNGVYTSDAKDEAKRAVFVGLQSAIEQVLSEKKLADPNFKVMMAIHTPTPATPLCTPVDSVSEGLMSARVKDDKQVQHTILSRAEILRSLLQQETPLYVVYQKNGLSKRTAEQQAIYKSEVEKYPNQLMSVELTQPEIDGDMIGATYLISSGDGQKLAFFIKATQANNPGDAQWQIGFGPADQQLIHERVTSVLNYLETSGQPKVKTAFESFGW